MCETYKGNTTGCLKSEEPITVKLHIYHFTCIYVRGVQSYMQRVGLGAGFHSSQAEATHDSTCLIS